VGDPFHGSIFTEEEFSAPDASVRTVACTIKADPDDLTCQHVFRHDGSDMGMVMLYRQQWDIMESGILICKLRGEI